MNLETHVAFGQREFGRDLLCRLPLGPATNGVLRSTRQAVRAPVEDLADQDPLFGRDVGHADELLVVETYEPAVRGRGALEQAEGGLVEPGSDLGRLQTRGRLPQPAKDGSLDGILHVLGTVSERPVEKGRERLAGRVEEGSFLDLAAALRQWLTRCQP